MKELRLHTDAFMLSGEQRDNEKEDECRIRYSASLRSFLS